jgi:chromosome segregation ATPase
MNTPIKITPENAGHDEPPFIFSIHTTKALEKERDDLRAQLDAAQCDLQEAEQNLRCSRESEQDRHKFFLALLEAVGMKGEVGSLATLEKQIVVRVDAAQRNLADLNQSIGDLAHPNSPLLLAEIAELKSELARVQDIISHPGSLRHHIQKAFPEYRWEHPEYIDRLTAAAEEAEQLQLERDEARADSARLDWLDNRDYTTLQVFGKEWPGLGPAIPKNVFLNETPAKETVSCHDSVRAAIDAARGGAQ